MSELDQIYHHLDLIIGTLYVLFWLIGMTFILAVLPKIQLWIRLMKYTKL